LEFNDILKKLEPESKFISKLKRFDESLYRTMADLVSMAQRLDRIMEIILSEEYDDVQKEIMHDVYKNDST